MLKIWKNIQFELIVFFISGLHKVGLKICPDTSIDTCSFSVDKVKKNKILAIKNAPVPSSMTHLQSAILMDNYYGNLFLIFQLY